MLNSSFSRRLILLTTAAIAALTMACADDGGDDALDGGSDVTASATANAAGDTAKTASLSREQLEPLLTGAQLQSSDLPGKWKATDLGMMEGGALATSGGQQTLIGQAIIEECLASRLEGGDGKAADAGVIRAFVSDSILGSVISTVSRAGDGAARTVEALRQPVTDEMKTCVHGQIEKSFGGAVQGGAIKIGELRSVSALPAGTGANVVTMTLGADEGSAITQQIVTASVARDGLLATAVEVTISGGAKAPEPPLSPERLTEVAKKRLDDALGSR